jgi:hypothetical protein
LAYGSSHPTTNAQPTSSQKFPARARPQNGSIVKHKPLGWRPNEGHLLRSGQAIAGFLAGSAPLGAPVGQAKVPVQNTNNVTLPHGHLTERGDSSHARQFAHS